MSKLWVSHLFRLNFHNKHSTYFGKDAQRCFDSMAEQREGTHLAWISPVRPSLIVSLHIARCYELTKAQVFWMFIYKLYAWAISAFFWSRLLFCQPWQFVLTWGLLHLLSQSPDPQSETSTKFLALINAFNRSVSEFHRISICICIYFSIWGPELLYHAIN